MIAQKEFNERLEKHERWLSEDSTDEALELIDEEIADVNISNTDFLEAITLSRCLLRNCTFEGALFDGSYFFDCNFEGVTFKDCSFYDCELNGSAFKNSNFINCVLTKSDFAGCSFASCNIQNSDLSWTFLNRVLFEKSILQDVVFEGANIRNIRLNEVEIRTPNEGEKFPASLFEVHLNSTEHIEEISFSQLLEKIK